MGEGEVGPGRIQRFVSSPLSSDRGQPVASSPLTHPMKKTVATKKHDVCELVQVPVLWDKEVTGRDLADTRVRSGGVLGIVGPQAAMDGGRGPGRPRKVSVSADLSLLQDGEVLEVDPGRENHCAPGKPSGAGGRMERRHLMPQVVHQRHMPREPLKFHIPRKTKEKRALFQNISAESREHEDMLTILTSSYMDSGSTGSFIYSNPRLVHNEQLEKEFVDKRKEMKADGRTDKELEEGYCFLMAESQKLQPLCAKGLSAGHSWITALGDPAKGVYLSRYSDLLQVNLFTPGASADIIIFKVMKGKVKSIYENMKNLLDPTPRFDSHLSKNTSKVTALTSYRAFELTQQYFYEYAFDELRQRPRQVCPYAVISFHFKGKDCVLPTKPLAPVRSNSQSAEGSKDLFTVWNGDLVKGERLLFQVCLRSVSPPFIPHKLPDKLDVSWLMRFDRVTRLLPPSLFSYNLYSSSHEVVKDGHYCSLLEVVDRSRSTTSITRLLNELERKRLVLVIPLTERGILFFLSSVQMANSNERGEGWRRSLQALFIFPQSRKVKPTLQSSSTMDDAGSVMPQLKQFVPALHQALVKARANPPLDLSAFVEHQAAEYLNGLNDGKVRAYPMGEYDTNTDKDSQQVLVPVPKHHQLKMDSYLNSYLFSPNHYLLSVARARQVVGASFVPEELTDQNQDQRIMKTWAGQRKATGEETSVRADRWTNQQKRNAGNEVEDVAKMSDRKRRMEQDTSERALKFRRASQEYGGSNDVRGLNQTTKGVANPSVYEDEREGESCPFGRLATQLGLPTSSDLDLRKQDELEEQTAGSVSSLEGFSPGSHSGELNHHRAAGRGGGWPGSGLNRSTGAYEEDESDVEIPWVLIPITGVCSERYTHRERKLPQDPRFHHLITATKTSPPNDSPTPSPEPSPPPSPSQCPSPEPSPPPSMSQCPSPVPSPPPSPSQCPSPDPSPPPSPNQCPSPEPSPTPSHSARLSPPLSMFNSLPHGTNEEQPASPGPRGGLGPSVQQEEPCLSSSHLTPEEMMSHSPPLSERGGVKEELPITSSLSPPTWSSPTCPQGIDSIVSKHLGGFSSDIQLLLQEQSVQYSFPQALPPATLIDTPSPQHTLLHSPIGAFSQYVSFHHPCPPVQGYISTLQDNISNVLTQFEERQPLTNIIDVALASSVSAFVASIRAANDDQNGTVADELPADDPPSTPHLVAVSDPSVTLLCNEPSQQCRSPQRLHDSSESSRTVSCITRQTGIDSSRDKAAACSGAHPGSGSATPTTALSSLISQLQPEVFTSLEEIINDVRKNSLQFYVHSTDQEDPVDADVKEYLLKQGNIVQSPAAFLSQDSNTKRLLVVIKNKDIPRHVHQIPGLLSLKYRNSVVFVGIDKSDDIRNNGYNELFVSGGCVVSDELVLNPDFISHDQLTSLLKAVEQQSSPEGVWRWKIHCKTHKKLKEQARFRRDAASLLDVLSSYQKRQIVEFLPHHHCDMTTHQSPDLDCLLELQARNTQYRHTVFLTERRIDFSQWGIIVASVDELQHNFSRLVAFHDNTDRQPITDDLQEPKGPTPHPPSSDSPHGLPLWSGSTVPDAPHLSDQLVPESSPAASSSKDRLLLHSDSDMEFLHQAISQLRAQRQAQKQLIQSQVSELDAQPLTSHNKGGLLEKRAYTCTLPSGQRGTPTVKKAVAATLDLIHSELQPETESEIKADNNTQGLLVSSSVRPDVSVHRPTELTQACDSNSANEKRDGPDQADQATACSSSSPAGGDRGRASESHQSDGASATLTGSVTMVTGQEDGPVSAQTRHQPQQQLHHLQQGGSLMHPPHLPFIRNHPFPHRAMLGPLAALRGVRSLLGPTPGWARPIGHAALVWTLPSRDLNTPPLGGYHPPAGPRTTYRGQSGGRFNGI